MKKSKRITYISLIIFFLTVFIISCISIVRYLGESKKQAGIYDELAELVESDKLRPSRPSDSPDQNITNPEPSTGSDNPKKTGILPEYATIWEKNPDTVGWISIPDTVINYPVMQSPDRPNYYLHRNFYGENSSHGAIYAGEYCNITKPSDNIVLYGHNMKDGSMFAALNRFKREDFLKEHPDFHFDTLSEHHTYEIFSVFTTTATKDKGFPYHQMVDAASKESFDDFVDTCIRMSHYDTGIKPKYGDKLLCLSTCDYSMQNGRFVVAARKTS